MNHSTGNNGTDKQLVNKVLAGDNAAFGLIIKNTERMVAQIVHKMISNAEDRKDLAQDIYLKAYKKLPAFKFQSKLSTWIARIGYNTCLDYLRKKKLILPGSIDEEKEPSAQIPDNEMDDLIHRRGLSAILQTGIELLSPVQRALITLHHQEELSYEEIGQITGLPSGTVKNYLFRARRSLKNNLLLYYKKEDLC